MFGKEKVDRRSLMAGAMGAAAAAATPFGKLPAAGTATSEKVVGPTPGELKRAGIAWLREKKFQEVRRLIASGEGQRICNGPSTDAEVERLLRMLSGVPQEAIHLTPLDPFAEKGRTRLLTRGGRGSGNVGRIGQWMLSNSHAISASGADSREVDLLQSHGIDFCMRPIEAGDPMRLASLPETRFSTKSAEELAGSFVVLGGENYKAAALLDGSKRIPSVMLPVTDRIWAYIATHGSPDIREKILARERIIRNSYVILLHPGSVSHSGGGPFVPYSAGLSGSHVREPGGADVVGIFWGSLSIELGGERNFSIGFVHPAPLVLSALPDAERGMLTAQKVQ